MQVLQLALAAGEAETMQGLLKPVVEKHARDLAAEPEIAEMLDQARKYRNRKAGVASLPRKRSSSRSRKRQQS